MYMGIKRPHSRTCCFMAALPLLVLLADSCKMYNLVDIVFILLVEWGRNALAMEHSLEVHRTLLAS